MSLGSSIAAQIAEIKEDVGRIGNKIARGVAQKALEDMTEAHTQIMNSYYAGYSPTDYYTYVSPKTHLAMTSHGYERTDNLRNGSFQSLGVTGGGHTFSASVLIGPISMGSYVNSMGLSFPGSAVFGLVWDQGIRGLPPGHKGYVGAVEISASANGVPMSGSPNNAMSEFMDQWWDIVGSAEADRIAFSV